ncbi:helix-turn-helix domain protein, partial [Neisseria meningitidis 94018]
MQLSLTEKGQYAVAYGLSCKKDCHELHATDPRRTIPHPIPRHCTVTEIAKQLNRHKSTISREIRRHRTQGQQYSAEKAQRQSRTIKQRKRQPYKLDSQLIQHIDTLIRRKLSPEQV